MSQELTRLDPTDLVARVSEGRLQPAEQVLIKRLVKLRQGQQPPSREELALMVGEAQHLGLDVFAKECYFINFDGTSWECFPHWQGLVKIAERTGEYLGHRGPFYSADGKEWSRAWLADDPPPLCMVTVLRQDHEPTVVVVKYKRHARSYMKNGVRKLMPQWESNPEEMLGKAALRLAMRRAFPGEADRGLSKGQLRALQTLAAMRGLGGPEKRPERLTEVSEIVGRPVESFKDLSVAEATEVYEALAEDLGDVLPGDIFEGEGLGEDSPDPEAGVAGESAGHPPAGEPSAAASADDPQELAELRKKGAEEYRRLTTLLPAEWRPWFRKTVEAIQPGAWEEWPKSFSVAQLKEFFERLDEVRPWGDPGTGDKQ